MQLSRQVTVEMKTVGYCESKSKRIPILNIRKFVLFETRPDHLQRICYAKDIQQNL